MYLYERYGVVILNGIVNSIKGNIK